MDYLGDRKVSTLSCRGIIATSSVFLSFLFVSATQAGTIVQCGEAFCAVDFSIDIQVNGGGSMTGTGEFLYDASSGDISLNLDASSTNATAIQNGTLMWTMGTTQVRVSSLSGNADPILGFGVGATTGAAGASFGFNFDLPIALQGSIFAESSLGYTLTSLTSAGAQITSLGPTVLNAYELDTSPLGLGALDKGVNVGTTFGFLGSGTQTTSFGATNTIVGDLAYDLMAVELDFGLSANSIVGITGFVSQTEVPVPAAAWLFMSAVGGLLALRKTK